jgi:hypothetical protein
MELENLKGCHILKGIELGTREVDGFWKKTNSNYIKFTLDDTTYLAVEDEADGYRSYMRELEIVDEKCKIKIPNIQVVCKMRKERYEDCDILEFIDLMNGEMILAIGTGNTNDYYPYCCFEYYPEKMACNEERRANNG